jgi:hypothetical protein
MLDRRYTRRLSKREHLAAVRGRKGVGEEPKHTTAGKPDSPSIIQYSLGEAYLRGRFVLANFLLVCVLIDMGHGPHRLEFGDFSLSNSNEHKLRGPL